jgi:hypothetical protein
MQLTGIHHLTAVTLRSGGKRTFIHIGESRALI